MMKKWVLLAAAAVLAVNVTGCKSGGDAPSGTKNAAEASTQAGSQAEPGDEEAGTEESKGEAVDPAEEEIPNPFKELDGPEGLKELQLNMEVPEGAEEIQCFSIDNEIGEVSFVLDGHKYAYRGAAHAEDFSGIFEEFEPDELGVSDLGADGSVVIKTTVSGGRLASWEKGGAKYTLYTPDAVEDGALIQLCSALIEKN